MRTLFVISLTLYALSAAVSASERVRTGTGSVRYLGLIEVYEASLFAPAEATAEQIQQAATDFCLEFDYQVELQPAQFIEAAEKVLERQHNQATLAVFRKRIDQLHTAYQPVREGDRYRLCYNLNADLTTLSLNHQPLVTLPGADFAALYAGIWLADRRPLSEKLQQSLLAGVRKGSSP
jgi:hypothetical protein